MISDNKLHIQINEIVNTETPYKFVVDARGRASCCECESILNRLVELDVKNDDILFLYWTLNGTRSFVYLKKRRSFVTQRVCMH